MMQTQTAQEVRESRRRVQARELRIAQLIAARVGPGCTGDRPRGGRRLAQRLPRGTRGAVGLGHAFSPPVRALALGAPVARLAVQAARLASTPGVDTRIRAVRRVGLRRRVRLEPEQPGRAHLRHVGGVRGPADGAPATMFVVAGAPVPDLRGRAGHLRGSRSRRRRHRCSRSERTRWPRCAHPCASSDRP